MFQLYYESVAFATAFFFINVITVVLRCSFHEIPDSKTAEGVPTEVE